MGENRTVFFHMGFMEQSLQKRIALGFSFLIDILVLDQLTKWYLTHTATIEIIPGFFRIMYLENKRIAFSLPLEGMMLQLLTVLFIAAIIWAIISQKLWEKKMFFFCAVAILGGAIGNAIDRFLRGYVIDFISVGTFPVFNVADMAVTLGVIFLFIASYVEERRRIMNVG